MVMNPLYLVIIEIRCLRPVTTRLPLAKQLAIPVVIRVADMEEGQDAIVPLVVSSGVELALLTRLQTEQCPIPTTPKFFELADPYRGTILRADAIRLAERCSANAAITDGHK